MARQRDVFVEDVPYGHRYTMNPNLGAGPLQCGHRAAPVQGAQPPRIAGPVAGPPAVRESFGGITRRRYGNPPYARGSFSYETERGDVFPLTPVDLFDEPVPLGTSFPGYGEPSGPAPDEVVIVEADEGDLLAGMAGERLAFEDLDGLALAGEDSTPAVGELPDPMESAFGACDIVDPDVAFG